MTYQSKLEQLAQKKAAFQKSSPARDRITALFDEGTFVELDAFVASGEEGVGVITGYGSVDGDVVYAFSQDITTLGGAVSKAHAEKIAKIYDLAVKNGAPDTLEVAVDNQCSVENVTRFARNAGYQVEVQDFEGDFKLVLKK